MTRLEPNSDNPAVETRYVFDNAAQETRRRFAGLPLVFDPGTIRHLIDCGVGPGWQCLVGRHGSIAG